MIAHFPKTNKKRYTNSVIGIPRGESLVQTLVLWHSSLIKNAILLAPTDRLVPFNADTTAFGSPIGLMFGAAQCIRAGYWKYQGTVDIQVPPEVYTFVSAAHIYRGDEVIGEAGSQQGLMTLSAGGLKAVENEIAGILDGNLSPFQSEEQELAREIIRKHLQELTPIKPGRSTDKR
jgi:hypothetical protein